MPLDDLLRDVKTLAIVCNQWGDTGKGKFVDYFSEWADIIARGTGGANAGHTISIGGKQYIFHLVPSGIIYDGQGKTNIIGRGVAFDPLIMKHELEVLDSNSMSYENLMISMNARLVLPHHLVLDRLLNSADGQTRIGTTGKGIGPLYEDRVGRRGLTVNDMLNKDIFRRKLEKNLEHNMVLLSSRDPEKVKEVLQHKDLGEGMFYHPKKLLNIDAIVEMYSQYGRFFGTMIADTEQFLIGELGIKNVLLEGAQGFLLSIDEEGQPYNTSSDCSIDGLKKGTGVPHDAKVEVLGLAKFYMTRVGEGPFPTEFGGKKSEEWCRPRKGEDKRRQERELYAKASVNSEDEFEKGIAVRMLGDEYGATTGRARRTGWLDLPLLRRAVITNGRNVVLTKVDVLNDCDTVKICVAYEYRGMDYVLGNELLSSGSIITHAQLRSEVLDNCRPMYKEFPGWKSDISGIRKYEDIPQNLRSIIDYIERSAGVNVAIVSVGPDREQTIVR